MSVKVLLRDIWPGKLGMILQIRPEVHIETVVEPLLVV